MEVTDRDQKDNFDLLSPKVVVPLCLFIILFFVAAASGSLGLPGLFSNLFQGIVLQGKGRGWGFMVG